MARVSRPRLRSDRQARSKKGGRTDQANTLLREGMPKAQSAGMQMHALFGDSLSVNRISNDGTTKLGQMSPQLMGSSGEGPQPKTCDRSQWVLHLPDRDSRPTVRMTPITRWTAPQPCKRAVDLPTPSHPSMHIGQIQLVHLAECKQCTAAAQRFQSSRKQQHSRGVAIQTVHQAEPMICLLQSRNQCIRLRHAHTRLGQQPGWFVHCQQPAVAQQDIQGFRRSAQCRRNKAST